MLNLGKNIFLLLYDLEPNFMTTTRLSSRLEAIYEGITKLISEEQLEVPLLPEVAGKVVQLTQDPDSDASALANLIQSDQTLAAHVMRVANSAAYSPNATMVSLQQALARLGMRTIAEITLAASVNSSLFNTPGYEKHIEYILHCSFAAGLWSKETARACRKNVEAAFLAGLLHDIGKPVAVQCALELAQDQGMTLDKPEVLELEKAFNLKIGMIVLDKWEMPESVKNVVKYFDNYHTEHNGQLQTKIVVAGSKIAQLFHCDEEEENCPTRDELIKNEVFAEINLYRDEVEALLEKEEAVNSAIEAILS